ncbi:hypothetical protein CSUI_005235 [Cystoisospora suis]|uniref:Uncharacterized protein n=1 Tax=Cystoisospora suis TaxID=483139 RepID=A0A2C6KY93_9APIC|nr:hypothetical protein CSUI_005235 [Cystoisospora suis]
MFPPGFPVLLEELVTAKTPRNRSALSSSSSSSFESLRPSSSPPRCPSSPSSRTVRVIGSPICFLPISNCILLRGLLDRRFSPGKQVQSCPRKILVDIEWLPPSIFTGLGVCTPEPQGKGRRETNGVPLLQVIGEVSCISLALLPQEERDLIGQLEQEEREEEQEEKKSEISSRLRGDGVNGSFSPGLDHTNEKKEKEKDSDNSMILLKARMCRRVDGLDFQLYVHSIQLLRGTLS